MNNKAKNKIGIVLLIVTLIIIKLILVGIDLYNLIEQLMVCSMLLIVISFILMIVPFTINKIKKQKIKYKQGRKICFLNSFTAFILFSIPLINIIVNKNINNTEVTTIDPVSFAKKIIVLYAIIAIIYYFINMCFFVDNKK